MKRLKEIIEDIYKIPLKKKVDIFINEDKITDGENLTSFMSSKIKIDHRVTEGSGKCPYLISIKSECSTIVSVLYKEYPYCCGQTLLHQFYILRTHTLLEGKNISDSLIGNLLKLSFECMRINKYSAASFVISENEQPEYLKVVSSSKELHDETYKFKNKRNDHICHGFIKYL